MAILSWYDAVLILATFLSIYWLWFNLSVIICLDYSLRLLMVVNEQSADTNTTDSGQNYLKLSPGSSDEEKQMVMGESHGTTRQQNATAQELNFTDTKVIENASLKPEERSCEMEVVEVYPPFSSKLSLLSSYIPFVLLKLYGK